MVNEAQFCQDCKERGQLVAPEFTLNGRGVCRRHYTARMGQPPRELAKEKAMLKVDWDAVQRDRDAGATTTALAEKYDCSTPTVCAHTKPANGKARAPKPPKRPGNGNGVQHEGMTLDEIISELRKRRDVLSAAIGALEGN